MSGEGSIREISNDYNKNVGNMEEAVKMAYYEDTKIQTSERALNQTRDELKQKNNSETRILAEDIRETIEGNRER